MSDIVMGTTIQKLGSRLAELLDDNQWNNTEPLLLDISDELNQLRTDNAALMGAVKGVLDSMDKYDGGQADIGRVWIACAKLTGVYIAISGRGEE